MRVRLCARIRAYAYAYLTITRFAPQKASVFSNKLFWIPYFNEWLDSIYYSAHLGSWLKVKAKAQSSDNVVMPSKRKIFPECDFFLSETSSNTHSNDALYMDTFYNFMRRETLRKGKETENEKIIGRLWPRPCTDLDVNAVKASSSFRSLSLGTTP